MSPFVAVLVRYTSNAAMFFGVLIIALAAYDYWNGPSSGAKGPLYLMGVGVAIFLIGWRSFRKLAREFEGESSSREKS